MVDLGFVWSICQSQTRVRAHRDVVSGARGSHLPSLPTPTTWRRLENDNSSDSANMSTNSAGTRRGSYGSGKAAVV